LHQVYEATRKVKFVDEDGNEFFRQKCEVYSRVVGYLRPVFTWNGGKQQEFHDRRVFEV